MTKIMVMILAAISFSAEATNYPCSGMKGGISHCLGAIFICNDGSPSQSKKNCTAEGYGGRAAPAGNGDGGADNGRSSARGKKR